MDLRSKLNIYKENKDSSAKQPDDRPQRLCSFGDLPAGTEISNEYGSFYMMERSYPLQYVRGGYSLAAVPGVSAGCLSYLSGIDAEFGIHDLLFLDTETTGLSGGAGTVAFLTGTGCFTEDAFVIRQYFMRDYDEEAAMLKELDSRLSGFKGLVTFNGRSFDWNLLSGRFISNRIKPSLREPLHVDLLYPARRIWGLKFESCRLSSLEENILGEKREDDIPGAMIPAVYFKYLEERNTVEIRKVIEHNEMDILSMVPLIARMSDMLEMPLSNSDGAHELFGLGRIFEARGELERTVECLESCANSESYPIRSKAVKHLTGIYKRSGNYERAIEHWTRQAVETKGFDLFSMVQLAMYYEHKTKDPAKALDIVDTAVQAGLKAGLNGSRQFAELLRRQQRLRRKTKKT